DWPHHLRQLKRWLEVAVDVLDQLPAGVALLPARPEEPPRRGKDPCVDSRDRQRDDPPFELTCHKQTTSPGYVPHRAGGGHSTSGWSCPSEPLVSPAHDWLTAL